MAESSGAREHHLRGGHALSLAQRTTSDSHRVRSEDSWIEISSQPSSSSLSSINDEIITTGLRVQQDPRMRRRRRLRQGAPTHLNITSRAPSVGTTSSQEEYEESESESDRVMTSSNEELRLQDRNHSVKSPALQSTASDDEDEDDKTAINYPINNDHIFTPQPNAFTHSSSQARSQPSPGSYFPLTDRPTTSRQSSNRHSYPPRQQHSPYNMIAPNYSAAADHDAALRASLSTLISFAGAARNATSTSKKSQSTSTSVPPRASTRPEANTLRMVPESALREESASPPLQPRIFDESSAFKPTIRRTSTSTTASADNNHPILVKPEAKRKATPATNSNSSNNNVRSTSKDRRISKKQRRASSSAAIYGCSTDSGDFYVTPTLFTWVVVAGVGVFISALSFSAGYALGKEAGRLEVGVVDVGEVGGEMARDAVGRSGLGLKKLRFGSGVRVGA